MPIEDASALAAEVFADSKKKPGASTPGTKPGKKAGAPGPVGVPASDGAYVDPAGEDVPAGEAAAAQGMIAAMKKGDAGGMARAMKSFIEICYPSLGDAEAAMKAEPTLAEVE